MKEEGIVFYKGFFILLITLFVVGCITNPKISEISHSQLSTGTPSFTQLTSSNSMDPPIIIEQTATTLPTDDNRTKPENWKDFPIIPEPTNRSVEIFSLGKQLGNNLNSFSKIGDCHNIKEAFLGFFDFPERVILSDETLYLQETLIYFRGNFNRDGFAVKGGLNAPSMLSVLRSDPDFCLSGESPLACELRINKHVIAFVSFEEWWKGRTIEVYENYLKQIVEIIISNGTIPVLITKADNQEGDHSINFNIAKIAFEYDIPLINWWKHAQTLPNKGMDIERDDGFHISQTSWTERSYDALKTLTSLMQGIYNEKEQGFNIR